MKKFNCMVDEYIKLRRHFGYKLKDTEALLKKFAVFLESKQARYITTELASCFVNQNKQISVAVKSSKMNKIRQFAIYMKGIEPKTEIPSSKIFPFSYHRANPYIYSQTDIKNLLLCCNKLWQHKSKLILRDTYFSLFGLIAVSGMRINEALSLTKSSVDLFNGLITVTKSKFSKSRVVPLHSSTKDALNKYIDAKIQLSLMSKSDFFLFLLQASSLSPGMYVKHLIDF